MRTSDEEGRRATLGSLADRIRVCTQCALHQGRANAVPGEGPLDASVLLIGEAPGREEDAQGRPFVGQAGRILEAALKAARLARDEVFITNVVKCRPPENRAPKSDEVDACRPYLLAQIEAVRPQIVVTLGATGLRSLLGSAVDLKEARPKVQSLEGRPLVATYHPAAVLYNRKLEREFRNDLRRVARMLRPKKARVRSAPPRADRPFQTTVSSGAVVVDPEGRFLLIKRADEDIWCLPKGTVEAGESLEATAIREIEEETGLRVKLLRPLLTIHYQYYWPPKELNYDKSVAYFLAEPVRGRLQLEAGFDEARWFSRPQALRLLHWKNDRDVVQRAAEILEASRPTGRTTSPGRKATRWRRPPA